MTDAPRQSTGSETPSRRSIWKSKSLLLAGMIFLVGIALMAYAAATRPAHDARAGQQQAVPEGLVSGFSSGSTPTAPAAAPEPRLIDKASPAVARFGGCFVAGFCVAYAFKKFIKLAAIITGVVLIGVFALQKSGVINVDAASIHEPIERSIAWLKGEAGAMKDFVLGYLPSSVSTAAGLFMGFRKG